MAEPFIRLAKGDKIEVINREDERFGRTGIIKEIEDTKIVAIMDDTGKEEVFMSTGSLPLLAQLKKLY